MLVVELNGRGAEAGSWNGEGRMGAVGKGSCMGRVGKGRRSEGRGAGGGGGGELKGWGAGRKGSWMGPEG